MPSPYQSFKQSLTNWTSCLQDLVEFKMVWKKKDLLILKKIFYPHLFHMEHFPAAVVALELPRDGDWSHVSASEFLSAASTALEQDRVAFAEFFI